MIERRAPSIVSHRWRPIWVLVGLALLTAAVYYPVGGHTFLNYDDHVYVTDNAQVRNGLSLPSVIWAFTNTSTGNWHPLAWVSHLLDVQLFGMRAGAHHLVGAALHIANVLLLFCILHALTGALWPSALVAALFAVHPLHVESVAWVAERKDVLSTCLWGLTVLAYVRYVRDRRKALYATMLGMFTLALMAKPMVVTLPGVLLLLDYWPLGRLTFGGAGAARQVRRTTLVGLLIEKAPLLALAAAASAAALVAQSGIGAVASTATYSLPERISNIATSYIAYIGKALWPVNLAVYYPRASVPVWMALGAVALVALFTTLALIVAGRRPYLAVGWFWYLGTLVPVIGLVRVGEQALADRYTYIPLVGLFIALAWSGADVAPGRRFRTAALAVIGAAPVVALALTARVQLGYWRDSVSLFEHCRDVTRGNWLALQSLGEALQEKGETDQAVGLYLEALRLKPDIPEVHTNLGDILASRGRYAEAIRHYAAALSIAPRWETHNNFGLALVSLGRGAEAANQFAAAVRMAPPSPEPLLNLGLAVMTGQPGDAEQYYRRALAMDPASVRGHFNLGALLARAGRSAEAIEQFRETLRLDPGNAAARANLERALRQR